MSGYIKLYRDITQNPRWLKNPFSEMQAWIDLLLLANYKDSEIYHCGKIITVKRGQVCRSISQLADRWKWDRQKTRRYLLSLQKENMIIINRCINDTISATYSGSLITLVNYEKFQSCENEKDGISESSSESSMIVSVNHQPNHQCTYQPNHQVNHQNTDKINENSECVNHQVNNEPNHQPIHQQYTYKEIKNKRNKNIYNNNIYNNISNNNNIGAKKTYSENQELNQAILFFIEHRKKLKKPMTEHAVDLLLKKLSCMASTDDDKIKLLNTAIERGWQTVYADDTSNTQFQNTQKQNTQKPKQNSFNSHTQQQYDFNAIKQLKGGTQ